MVKKVLIISSVTILILFIWNFYVSNAISGYTQLDITIESNGSESIYVNQYSGETNLQKVIIENGITEIHDEAFAYCTNLSDITIPRTVNYISEWAFWQASNNLTIHGYSGSYAEEYAEKYGYNFEYITKEIKSISDSSEETYSLEEEIISNNISGYPEIYNNNNIYNETKVSIISALERLSKIQTNSTFSFGFLTDSHVNANDSKSEVSINAFTALSSTGAIKIGILGGDLYSSYSTTYQEGLNYERHVIDKLSESEVPLLYVKGNHECNIKTGSSEVISDAKLTQVYQSSYDKTGTTGIVYDSNNTDGLYYYKDDSEEKVRYCVLNSFQGNSEDLLLSNEQIEFIAKEMLDFSNKENPEEWAVIFFIHRYQDTPSKEILVNIINAFQQGTSVTVNGQTIDYSGQGKGNFIALIGGDLHIDSSNCDDGFWYITTAYGFGTDDTIGTDEEFAFDIYTVDKEKKKLYATRVGRGNDREWDYGETSLEPEISYVYNSDNNTVTATITSNRLLADTKPTWTMDESHYIYTKTFYHNESYSTNITDEYGYSVNLAINITEINENIFSTNISYVLNNDNTVTATISSNIPMSDTKPTWTLSNDALTYTKIYVANEPAYDTSVVSTTGLTNMITVEIILIDSTGPDISINYNVNANGSVTMIATSNEKMADLKSTWVISDDGYTYYKTIYEDYSSDTVFTDLYGNTTTKSLSYTFSGTLNPSYQLNYVYNCDNKILAIVNSTLEMQNTKETWTLCPDARSYYKVYDENYTTNTAFTDYFGNVTYLSVVIDQINDNSIPNITINYVNNNDGSITVYAVSDKKLQDRKVTWMLSADRYTYSKTYSENYTTTSTFTDLFGNTTDSYTITISGL